MCSRSSKRPHDLFSKKKRRAMRSERWPDMRPHVFDKLVAYLPGVLKGIC